MSIVNFEGISNSDIRKIFGLGEKEKAKASRLLTSAVDGGYIKVMNPDTAPRYKKYIPSGYVPIHQRSSETPLPDIPFNRRS